MRKKIFIFSLKNYYLFTLNNKIFRIFRIITNISEIRKYKKEIERRKSLDIFSIIDLSKDLNEDIREYYGSNAWYGNSISINSKLNKVGKIKGVIEHGLYLGENIRDEEVRYSPFKTIFTFGKYRKNVLERYLKEKKIDKKVIEVGPYILNVPNYLTKQKYIKLKKKLGKVLLVFPSHSIEGVSSHFTVETLINEINEKKQDFDTVLISVYWKDIQEGRHCVYEKAGFKVVTAGHRSDTSFLSRLKLIINLSSMTMSNLVGTHLGYCIALGKPHYLMSQEIKYTGDKVEQEFDRSENWKVKYEEEKEMFTKAFGIYVENITKAQLEIVKYYWGEF